MLTPDLLRQATTRIAITYAVFLSTDLSGFTCVALSTVAGWRKPTITLSELDKLCADWKELATLVHGRLPDWWNYSGWDESWQRERIALLRKAASYLGSQQ